jgi:hypothetical protein
VLAVAILGAAMVSAFAHSLRNSLAELTLNAHIRQELASNVARLASLDAPSETDPQTATMIRFAVARAFVYCFRLIMVLCAGLAIVSAGVAWRRIPSREAE